MFHASEEAKYMFDIIDIFLPDTTACIRYVLEKRNCFLDGYLLEDYEENMKSSMK